MRTGFLLVKKTKPHRTEEKKEQRGVRKMTIEATPKEIADLVDLLLSRQNEKNDLKIDSNSLYQAAQKAIGDKA